ncbi:EfeM/EfeO family lipoprotein [Kocuria sp. HSID16901]|uniref:EfeM/EfeO family lipoprotein n=1 Tax=Kocuria sp. HSID16901 TaxID=2419505 RepID=UPI0006617CF6|nr:EfeM/EfeO family lipoprotein [Kocuria sp. HSID16901]RUQ23330.1 EfeM/EfeO family lipoprotein [Kocuria sp. HSID16901]
MRHRLVTRGAVALCILVAVALIGYGLAQAMTTSHQQTVQGTSENSPHSGDGTKANPRRTRLEVGLDGCTKGWDDPGAGAQVFDIKNTSDRPMDVVLLGTGDKAADPHHDPRKAQIYAELEALGPGVTRSMTTSIEAGHFHFSCMPEDGPVVDGTDTNVPQPSAELASSLPSPVQHAAPATEQELIPYTQQYEEWVKGQLPDIASQADQLKDVIQRRGPNWREEAQSIWLTAHHRYMTLGGAYGAFGDLGDSIDGTAAGLPQGPNDPDFTGFHRIERGLWANESPDDLLPLAQGLSNDLSSLQDQDLAVGALEIGLRTHEVSEDIATQTLSGVDDFGSHSGVDSARAQTEATQKLVEILRPLLADRMPADHLTAIDQRLDAAQKRLDDASAAHPQTAPADLPVPERNAVRSQIGQLSEQLAEVAAVTDIRRAT